MPVALSILIASIAAVLALGLGSGRVALAGRVVAIAGPIAALGAHLYAEGLTGGGVAGIAVGWPGAISWMDAPLPRADTLSAVLGAWCLLLGALCMLPIGDTDTVPAKWDARQAALGLAALAALYSLVHTFNLLALALEILLLAVIAWSLSASSATEAPNAHSTVALGLGAVLLLAAALVIGRTTGGQYSLAELSLSSLTVGALVMVALGAALWLGLPPFTGWSGRVRGGQTALVGSLVVLVPVAVLLLRLEALVTAQGLAGSAPQGWGVFTALLAWGGGIGAVVAAAGSVAQAGTARWPGAISGYAGALVAWALGQDNPGGRHAALVLVIALGAGVAARELSEEAPGASSRYARLARGVGAFCSAGAPLTAGFAGLWLLGAALLQTSRPSLVIVLAGATMLALCGTALHLAYSRSAAGEAAGSGAFRAVTYWCGLGLGLVIMFGGIAPSTWLAQAARAAQIAGGALPGPGTLPWTGISTGPSPGLEGTVPLLLMGLMVFAVAGIGWLLRTWMRSGARDESILLPTGWNRLESSRDGAQGGGGMAVGTTSTSSLAQPPTLVPAMAPAPIWWLSLEWVEDGIWGLGMLLLRVGARAGLGLGRLEGHYYLPLALVLALIALLAITR